MRDPGTPPSRSVRARDRPCPPRLARADQVCAPGGQTEVGTRAVTTCRRLLCWRRLRWQGEEKDEVLRSRTQHYGRGIRKIGMYAAMARWKKRDSRRQRDAGTTAARHSGRGRTRRALGPSGSPRRALRIHERPLLVGRIKSFHEHDGVAGAPQQLAKSVCRQFCAFGRHGDHCRASSA